MCLYGDVYVIIRGKFNLKCMIVKQSFKAITLFFESIILHKFKYVVFNQNCDLLHRISKMDACVNVKAYFVSLIHNSIVISFPCTLYTWVILIHNTIHYTYRTQRAARQEKKGKNKGWFEWKMCVVKNKNHHLRAKNMACFAILMVIPSTKITTT